MLPDKITMARVMSALGRDGGKEKAGTFCG